MLGAGTYIKKAGNYFKEVGVYFVSNGKERNLPITLCDDDRVAKLTKDSLDLMIRLISDTDFVNEYICKEEKK